jgi:hypothetical protein
MLLPLMRLGRPMKPVLLVMLAQQLRRVRQPLQMRPQFRWSGVHF